MSELAVADVRPRDRGATERRILTEAVRLFADQGYTHVTVRAIAGAAGVNVSLINRYYGSKLGLFEAVLDTGDRPPRLVRELLRTRLEDQLVVPPPHRRHRRLPRLTVRPQQLSTAFVHRRCPQAPVDNAVDGVDNPVRNRPYLGTRLWTQVTSNGS